MFPHLRNHVGNDEERDVRRQFLLDRRVMRDNADPFQLNDTHFIQLFRLNKDLVHFLANEIGPFMHHSSNYKAIHPLNQIFVSLVFYATGTYQRVIGQSFHLSLSQQSVSRSISLVTDLIIRHLADRFINFPQTQERKREIKRNFMERWDFPGVIGVIDCTHIAILAPNIEEHNYLNRKGYHSKNVQLICDDKLEILNINPNYPGSCHDSFIWRNSMIQRELEDCFDAGDKNSWLLGDSGYPQQPWMMTPFANAMEGTPEFRYNEAHASARNCIERCNGVLKMRFRCLLAERKLRYEPGKTGDIATACVVLHNLCLKAKLQFDLNDNNEPQRNVEEYDPVPIENNLNGFNSRRFLVNRYFS